MHYIVEFDGSGQALIAELWLFSEDGNLAYIGDENGVLRFPLPTGAQDLGIDGDDGSGRFQRTADGFVDRMPLPPGQNTRQVLFRYSLPYSGDYLTSLRTLAYNAANVNALVSDVGQQVSSPQLASQGVRSTQNGNYVSLLGQNLAAGRGSRRKPDRSCRPARARRLGRRTAAAATGMNRGLLFALIAAGRYRGGALLGRAAHRAPAAVRRPCLPGVSRATTWSRMLARLDLAYEAGRGERIRLPRRADAAQGATARRGAQGRDRLSETAWPDRRPATGAQAAPADDTAGIPMIEVRKLTKAFGSKYALRGVNLRVMPGESVVLFGPNGAGKTTLIRILCSLSRPSSGTVHIGGLDLRKACGRHPALPGGRVARAPALRQPDRGGEPALLRGLYGMARPEKRIAEMLERVGLLQPPQRSRAHLLRGMVQRLAIARALLHDPEIMLLDEPDTGLDPQAAEMLHGLLIELSKRPEVAPADGGRRQRRTAPGPRRRTPARSSP